MKKTMFGIIAALAVIVCVMAGCPADPAGHTHTYSTEWSYNATQHWHECTSGDGAKADVANHDGTMPCSVCGYDVRRLRLSGQVHNTGEGNVIAGPLTGVSAALNLFTYVNDDDPVSDHFTGSAAITNGKIAVDLMPKDSELFPFSETYNEYSGNPQEICDLDAKGLMFVYLVDNDDTYYPSLLKADENGILTHQIVFIYIDRDLTFTDDTYYHELKDLQVKKGWNYISQEFGTYTCEVITDLSDYQWINY